MTSEGVEHLLIESPLSSNLPPNLLSYTTSPPAAVSMTEFNTILLDTDHSLADQKTDTNPSSPTITPTLSKIGKRTAESDSNVISKIEAVFEAIVDTLLEDGDKLSISIRVKNSTTSSILDFRDGTEIPSEIRQVTYPGGTPQEAWRFSRLVAF